MKVTQFKSNRGGSMESTQSIQNQALTPGQLLERVIIQGDLSVLTPDQKVTYYHQVCESIGLNSLTKPLEFIQLGGRMVLYAKKDATDQLRKIYGVSITQLENKTLEGVYVVTATAAMHGRMDSSTGAVSIQNLRGDALANAMMKAETKAKRRVTLSICGLGMLDETELETIVAQKEREFKQEPPKAIEKKEDPDFLQRKAEGQKIRLFREELGLSEEELKQEVHQMFGTDDFKKLTITQLKQISWVLEKEKQEKQGMDVSPEWEKEAQSMSLK